MYLDTTTLGWLLFGSLVFLVISALMGDHHVEAGGDAGHGGMDSGGDTHHGVTTSELFNFRNLALLCAGFSAACILARNAGYSEVVANLSGIGGGVVMAALGIWLFRIVRGQESNSITSNSALVDQVASVTTSIPEQGFGEITLRNEQGVAVSLTAKSNGIAINAGSAVKITAIAGNTATVSPAA